VGAALLAAYLIQWAAGLEWTWLAEVQQVRGFKLASGALLGVYVAQQWWLSVGRARGWARNAKRSYRLHKLLGALAPAFFYLHAVKPGYGFLLLLSTVYLANVGVGLASPDLLRKKPRWYTFPWMVVHVALAVLVTVLAGYHLWIAMTFE
jgi:hypothetical protein